jgi:hypothetical protein
MRQRRPSVISEYGSTIVIVLFGQIIVLGGALLLVSVLVEGIRRRLRPEERWRAQLEGVQFAAGEVADRFGNSLAVAACTRLHHGGGRESSQPLARAPAARPPVPGPALRCRS